MLNGDFFSLHLFHFHLNSQQAEWRERDAEASELLACLNLIF